MPRRVVAAGMHMTVCIRCRHSCLSVCALLACHEWDLGALQEACRTGLGCFILCRTQG